MATLTIKDIIKDFSEKKLTELDKFYLAVGEELYFINKLIVLLRNQARNLDFDMQSFVVGMEKRDFNEFLDDAYSSSLFSNGKIVIIRNAESLKQDEFEKLMKTINQSSGTLTFVHLLKEDKRKKIFKELRKNSTNFDIKTQNARTIMPWIGLIAKDKGLELNSMMLNLLESRIGTDLQEVDNELEKLKNYIGDNTVTADIIKEFISKNTTVSVFDFLEALFRKNKKSYYKYLYLLEESGENAIMVLSLIINRLSKLILVKNPIDNKTLRLNPFYLRKLQEEARNFSYTELTDLYKKLLFIDRKLKSSKLGFSLLYELKI